MVIIEDPVDPYDVDAWRSCIRAALARKGRLAPLYFDSLLAGFEVGLAVALAEPSHVEPGSLRERLRRLKKD